MRKLYISTLILWLCCLFCCTATAASTYPVQASVQVIKPSVYLEDYGDGFDERVSVVLLCRDAMSAGVQVRLRLTIKCQNGVTLRTKSHAVFSPITLYHGTPDRLGAAELAPYFDARNLDVTGSLVNGAMPEGVAQFSVEVLEYYTGVPLSLPASTVTNLTLARPPTLLFPRNGATLRFSEPLSLIFSWSVRSSIAAGDSYEFLLKEIADTNANTTSAFNYSQTIFRTETFATSIVYSVSEPPLEPGKTYAWCVRLMNSHAVNGGWSEVFTFRLDETEGVDGGEQSADAVSEPKRRSGECGEDSYRVTDLTPCDTPLSVGDTMTVGGGFPVIVREITQRGERFYGRGLMYVPYIGVSFAVSINGVRVNCLKQMIEGYTEVEHDASHSQIGGTDALLHGGATKLKNGVVMPDLAVDFTFPEGMKAALDSDAGTLVFYDAGGNVAGSVEMPRNEQGEPVFPVRVKDADGEIVQIDKAGDEGSEEGELTVTHIGKANSSELVHPRVTAYLRPDYGVVEFGDSDGSRFSFDAALPYYESVAILLNSDGAGGGGRVYRKMNGNYIVPWKFLSTGSTDKVTAKLTLTDEGKKLIKPEKLQFKTVTESGTVTLPSHYDASTGLYTVQVTAAQPDSKTSVFALYPYNGADSYLNLGVIDIDTRSTLEAKVCIVDLGGSANIHHTETELNAIYSKVGVHWSVTRESGFSYPKDSIAHLFDSKSKALELYNSHQKNLNRAFEAYLGDRYDGKTCYLFMMPANGSGSKRELAGFMPRGEQYGYINTESVKSENLPAVIAHELGHGKYRLRHTFDSEYGSAAERKKGGTDNLMDYTSSPYKSTHIAKWQWMQIHNPALLTEVWEKDEDSEWVVQVVQCLTGAAIDVVINYGFKWAELLMDGYPVEFTDYEKIFSEMNTAEVVTSAGIACATSVIPFPVDKSKANLIASFSAALGAGATAVAANLETQYNDIQRQYPDKSFNEVLSAVNWAEVLKNVGVQAVISGIATSVTIYATTHPKFIAFKDNLKKIGYAALHKRLVKAGLDDSAIDEFCKKFGISPDKADDIAALSESREILRGGTHSKLCNDPDVLEQVTKFRKIEGREKFGFDDDFLANAKGGAGLSYSELLNTCERFMSSVNKYNISIGEFDKVVSDLQKGGGFSVGSEWVMRYIAENGAELSGRKLRFEVVETIEDESRNLIRRIDVEEIIGRTKIFYEFKSVKNIPPANFYEQFGKDLMLDDVTSLDQLKWIFDGRKVTQRQLTENITNAIKQWKVPETILRKWGYQDNQYNFKEVFLIPYINKIFTVK